MIRNILRQLYIKFDIMFDNKIRLMCGCKIKPFGDKFDNMRRHDAHYTFCMACVRKKFPNAQMMGEIERS